MFLKGLPAIALAQALPAISLAGQPDGRQAGRRAGDILKKIPPRLAVAKYVGFTPQKPWESYPGSSKPHIFGHLL